MDSRLLALVILAVVALGGCGPAAEVSGTAASDPQPPESSPQQDGWRPVAVRLLGVADTPVPMGTVEHATDPGGFAGAWERFGLPGQPPAVDFDTHVVLVLSRAEDACPDLVGGLQRSGEEVAVDWRPPTEGCNQPLIPTAFVIRIHRGAVPADFTFTEPGFHSEYDDITHPVELPAYDGPPPGDGPPRIRPPAPSDVISGRLPVPSAGGVTTARLDDGALVWVVHQPDGEVDVLAADHPTAADPSADDAHGGVEGLRTLVRWQPSLGTFAGAGIFDRYGLSLDGVTVEPLDVFEAAVDGGEVVVGRRMPQPADPAPQVPGEPTVEAAGEPLDIPGL